MNNNEKRTFLSIVGNIWYYYKWHIIVGLCAVIMFAVAFTQYFSKVEPYVFFYYVGKSGPTAKDIDELCTQMQEIVPNDCNGDGKIKVSYKEDIFVMYSPDSESPDAGSYVYNTSEQMNIVQRFNFELGMGDCIVYIMEPNLFKANTDYIMSL